MTPHPRFRPPAAGPFAALALVLSLTLFAAPPLAAQPLSSGSGAGTGTGMSGGAARNSTGTGLESGPGNATGTGNESGAGLTLPGAGNYINPSGPGGHLLNPPAIGSGRSIPMGPGVDTTFPGDVINIPNLEAGLIQNAAAGSSVTERHLRYARGIPVPADRSLTLSRIASVATFSNQLDVADVALNDASLAAMQIPSGMIRDQRLISIITALLNLGEARLREGRGDAALPPPPSPAEPDGEAGAGTGAPPAPLPERSGRTGIIRRAQGDVLHAAELAQRIGNPTYRSELMYKVADAMAFDSQTIVNEFPRDGSDAGRSADGLVTSFGGLPDQLLVQAAALAARIDRPVWHDRGLVAVASAAAESRQFARALSVARMVPQPEVRTDALLKIAEIQARRNDPQGATATYAEAARAVASIPLDDPRSVLAGVLIDNLIAVGRFDDARASIALYPDHARRMVALGAIAESQGRRGAAASALAWINRDIPPAYRSQLYRRVSNGVVSAVEQNRSRDLSNRGDPLR